MRINRKKLIVAMLDRNLNVLQLAQSSGVSRATISSVKCGKSCSKDTGEKIARALGVPVENIVED